jgi:hypothetical protein
MQAKYQRLLEQAVNKWRERRALGENDNSAEQEQEHHDGREPPPFARAQESGEFFDDAQLAHGLIRGLMVWQRRAAISSLPRALRWAESSGK